MKRIVLLAFGSVLSLGAFAQANQPAAVVVETAGSASTYRVVVISRSVQAVNYRHRSGASEVDFVGTALLPSADGKAKVRSKRGTMEVEAEFGNLQNPTTFGAEYLTYVLWAISPEGRSVNLGEVLVGDNSRSKLTATTDLQGFALIVTAEPYYAVRQPSNVVVLENVIRPDTKGTVEAVMARPAQAPARRRPPSGDEPAMPTGNNSRMSECGADRVAGRTHRIRSGPRQRRL